MTGKASVFISIAALCACVTVAAGARMRPGGDPAKNRIIWADPFDNWDTEDHALNRLWQGGPWLPGDPSGTYPSKFGCGSHADNDWLTLYYRGNLSPDNDCTNLSSPFPLSQSVADVWLDSHCGGTGEFLSTQNGALEVNSSWVGGGQNWFTPMGMFSYDLYANRIASFVPRAWDLPNADAVNGTDDHPLTFIFYLHDEGAAATNQRSLFDNCYAELNLDGEHAPTDYIWRGNPTGGGDEYCPQGPYPIICQQVRELNTSVSEDQTDVDYLNARCPALVAPFDPQTGQGKTWPAIAFGFLAIGDKDPCGVAEQSVDAHVPTKDHMMLFDGNKWRELRNGRGTALTTCAPTWATDPVTGFSGPEVGMVDSGTGSSGNFSLDGGDNKVYLKLTSSRILIYHQNGAGTNYCGAFPRIYTGPFNRISFGVAPGCELDSASYTCKTGGTPKQCLRYSKQTTSAYNRTMFDSSLLIDGQLQPSTGNGACCKPDGVCVDNVSQSTCTSLSGIYRGSGSTCVTAPTCCPKPFADVDHDGDVDQDDFGAFQLCYTGGAGGVPTGCACFDRDGSGAIDAADFTQFQNCWSGPNVPWSSAVAPACVSGW